MTCNPIVVGNEIKGWLCDGIEKVIQGKCPYCEGPADIFLRYDSKTWKCHDPICARTFKSGSSRRWNPRGYE